MVVIIKSYNDIDFMKIGSSCLPLNVSVCVGVHVCV